MNDSTSRPILCFGEILWDSLPRGLFPGGAPINVAYHLKRLGRRPLPVTAVGDDFLGQELLRRLRHWEIETRAIHTIDSKPTGAVEVELSQTGSPRFMILEDVAWDCIQLRPSMNEWVEAAEAIVFGSLAQRSEQNRRTLAEIFEKARDGKRVFDVNLRPPFVDHEIVWSLARQSHLLKVNHEELGLLLAGPDQPNPEPLRPHELELPARRLADKAECASVCVTAGAWGAGWLHEGRWFWSEAEPVPVKDTVGAGDAFLAALVNGWLRPQIEPEPILFRACRLAEFVAAQDGATPPYTLSRTGEILAA